MNRHLYRVVFNKSRGLLMAVAEHTVTRIGTPSAQGGGRTRSRVHKMLVSASLAALGIIGQVAHAEIVADSNAPGNQQPTIIETANGRPQVNIQTPNDAGVSHNVYQQFDVDQQGAILNNSHTATRTQLGGYVDANPWLAHGEAKVILNEVNSSNPSHLNGWIEVAGRRADVIVANPSGIHCDGCGFINTDRGMLTTGRPVMEGDRFNGVHVEQGTVAIDGAGMDARQTSHTDVIARAVKVNAQVHGNDISVITGANHVDTRDADHPVITPIEGKAGTPEVALDVSALGGMYANRIALIGTEKGLGVHNAGVIGASAGDVSITANGQLLNTGTLKGGDQGITLKAQKGIVNQGQLLSDGALSLSTPTPLHNDRPLVAGGNLSIQAPEIYSTSEGILAAGVDAKGKFSRSGNVALKADRVISTHGKVLAHDGVSVTAPQIDMASAQVAGRDVRLKGLTVDTSAANLQAKTLDVAGAQDIKNDGGQWQADQITVTSPKISNVKGTLIHKGKTPFILNVDSFDNHEGVVAAPQADAAIVSTQSVDNTAGTLVAGGQLMLTAPGVNNPDGYIDAGKGMLLSSKARPLNNQGGVVQAGEDLTVASGSFDNRHGVMWTGGNLQLTSDELNNISGRIEALGNGAIVSSSLDNTNDGAIRSNNQLDIKTPILRNSGSLHSSSSAGIDAEQLALQADHIDNNQGIIRAGQALTLLPKVSMDNRGGVITAQGVLRLKGQRDTQIVNDEGILIGGDFVSIASGALPQQGQILSAGDLSLAVQDDVINHGELKANRDLLLSTQGRIDNDAAIQAGHVLALKAQRITNAPAGTLSGKQLTVDADDLTNRGLIEGGKAQIQVGSLTNLGAGRLYGDQLSISAQQLNNENENEQAPVIAARDRLSMAVATLTNRDHALLYSLGDMAIGGQLDADGHLKGNAQTLNNLSASIEAGGNLALNADEINNRDLHIKLSDNFDVLSSVPKHEYQPDGSAQRYDADHIAIVPGHQQRILLAYPGGKVERFNEYLYNHYELEAHIAQQDPSVIRSGGALDISGHQLNNYNSKVIAGQRLDVQDIALHNEDVIVPHRQVDGFLVSGNTFRPGIATAYWPGVHKGHASVKHGFHSKKTDVTRSASTDYGAFQRTYDVGLSTSTYKEMQSDSPDLQDIPDSKSILMNPVEKAHSSSGMASSAPAHHGIVTVNANQTLENGDAASPSVIRTMALDIHIPDSALFVPTHESDSHYSIETDPKFTQYKRWLGTDYMRERMSEAPEKSHKRLGDGFYEQQLVRDQVSQLTGQRYLKGFSDDESQFKALMDAGIAFGQQYNITSGVELSAQQMALLTSDMVWLVNRDITLADGSTQTVIVPQVYARLNEGDLTGNGSLLSGNDVSIQGADIVNGGQIRGREHTLVSSTGDITNTGIISGARTGLTAQHDIRNIGGSISGQTGTALTAGHDIASASVFEENAKERYLARQAGIYTENDNGTLALTALNNVTLTASDAINAGQDGQLSIMAGQDIALNTESTRDGYSFDFKKGTYSREATSAEQGSQLVSNGGLELAAGQDIHLKAADVQAQQSIDVQAGQDVNLTVGQQTTDLVSHTHTVQSGFLSKKTTDTHSEVHDRTAQGTTLSGDSVAINAGQNVHVDAGNVVGTQSVQLGAGKNIDITTADEQRDHQSWTKVSKSGLMKEGITGVMIGAKSEKEASDNESSIAHGSTIGASAGNTSLVAGNNLRVHGSDVISGHDLALQASTVQVDDARNRYTDTQKTEFKQTGVSLALTGMVGSMVNAAHDVKEAVESDEDDRLKALQTISAILKGVQAGQSIQGGQQGSTIALSVSLGQQKSSSTQTQTQDSTAGSTLGAGNDLAVTAHGQQGGGDLTLAGSSAKAAHDVTIGAARDLALISSEDDHTQTGSNKSGGGSIGASIGDRGLTVDLAANAGKGREKGNGVSHTETTVDAGNNVVLSSGRDALLQGAQVNGDSIRADIGRHLTLRSEQDEDEYKSTQANISGGISAGIGSGGAQGSASVGTMDSSFLSVKEQTGLFAGDGGYNVTVGDHTQLDGAVIGSRATDPTRNRLSTGTLGFSDIENALHFKVQQTGLSGGTGAGGAQMAMGAAATAVTALLGNNGDDSSTTHAAISQGDILIRDQAHQTQSIADLDRDVEHAANALTPLFDKAKEQQRLKALQTAQTIVNQAIDIGVNYGEHQAYEAASHDATAHAQATAAADAAVAQGKAFGYYSAADQHQAAYDAALKSTDAYAATMKDYGIGSTTQLWLQSGAHLATGLLTGDAKSAVASASAPFLSRAVKYLTTDDKPSEQLSKGEIALNAVGHAISGGLVAEASGNNAAVGAAGAAAGELTGHLAAYLIGGDKPTSDLTQSEREQISQWSQVAGGIAGGLAGGGHNLAAEMGVGAQAGKNAVENNFFVLAIPLAEGSVVAAAEYTGITVAGGIAAYWIYDHAGALYHSVAGMFEGPDLNGPNLINLAITIYKEYPLLLEYAYDNCQNANKIVTSFLNNALLFAHNIMSRLEEERINSTAGPRPSIKPVIALPGGNKPEVIIALPGYDKADPITPTSAPQYKPEIDSGIFTTPSVTNRIEDISFYARKEPYDSTEQEYISSDAVKNSEAHLASLAKQQLLDDINKFSSRSKAADIATMVGAYDPTTGRVAVGKSNGNITPEQLHPTTVDFVENHLGVKIGEFTNFCDNVAGTCAEVSAADQLIRAGSDPAKIKFTEAIRPRLAWHKSERFMPENAVVEPCENCQTVWHKGD